MVLLAISGPATLGQPRLERPDVRADVRYDAIDGSSVRERLQTAVRLEQRVAFSERVSGVLFVATGDAFDSRWVTVHDFRPGAGDVDPFRPRLRRAFVEARGARFRVQGGAIPPVKAVVSPTGLDPDGWIDGVRAEWYNAPGGTVEAVVGRLGSVETPSVFARPSPFAKPARANYAELEVSQQVRPWLRLEGSAEYLRALYLRSEVRWMPAETAEVFSEVLYNADRRAVIFGTTVEADPAALLLGRARGRVTVELAHAYKDAGIGLRGVLSDDFVTFGHSGRASVTAVLSRALGLRGWVEGILAEDAAQPGGEAYTRFKAGLSWRLP